MIRIVGAGVVGLSTALELGEAGFKVEVLTKDDPLDTTSAVAAALWWPYDPEPVSEARKWAAHTLVRFQDLAAQVPASGAVIRRGRYRQPVGGPSRWFDHLIHMELESSSDDVETYTLETPIIDMSVFLPWLQNRCKKSGIEILKRRVDSFEDLRDSDLVVNCSGLGARELAHDSDVKPLRGQVVIMRGTHIDELIKDETAAGVATYIYPRINTTVLGGTTEDSDSLIPDDATTAAIIERCSRLDPRVKQGEVVTARVGLRPQRFAIRLEIERLGPMTIVHNYGHGRSGVSLSWGCASALRRLCEATA